MPKHKSPAARPTWLGAHHAYAPHDVPQLTPSPSGEPGHRPPTVHSFHEPPTSGSFDQSTHHSPAAEGLVLNTTSTLTSSYPGYPLSPDSCIPSPGTSTTPALPVWNQPPPRSVSGMPMNPSNPSMHHGQWYTVPAVPSAVPFEPITPPSGIPHSAHVPSSIYHEQMAPVVSSGHAAYSPDFAHHYDSPEYHHYDPKHWKRPMMPYDYPPQGPPRPEHADRKPSVSHGPPPGMVPVPVSQSATSHPMMCAPVSYMGQDQMVKPTSSVGY